MQQADQPVAFWLQPCAADARTLQTVIDELSRNHDAPTFEPHITLLSATLAADENPQAILDEVAPALASIRLAVQRVDTGPTRFQSVFLRFGNAGLQRYSDALASACRRPPTFSLDAHLSLLYRELATGEQARIVAGLPPWPARITFDRLCAIAPGDGEAGFGKVQSWRTVARAALP